jgi:hypothetical protein
VNGAILAVVGLAGVSVLPTILGSRAVIQLGVAPSFIEVLQDALLLADPGVVYVGPAGRNRWKWQLSDGRILFATASGLVSISASKAHPAWLRKAMGSPVNYGVFAEAFNSGQMSDQSLFRKTIRQRLTMGATA